MTERNPFELGRQHKLAGIPLGDKRIPYAPHSKDWVRYQCGRQSIQVEQAKAEREASMTEQKSPYVPSDIAESHVTLGNAGSGPELDLEHVYPPNKWGHHKMAGPPYVVKPVETWPAEVDRRIASLEDEMAFLKRLIHRHINGAQETGL